MQDKYNNISKLQEFTDINVRNSDIYVSKNLSENHRKSLIINNIFKITNWAPTLLLYIYIHTPLYCIDLIITRT